MGVGPKLSGATLEVGNSESRGALAKGLQPLDDFEAWQN